MRLPSSASVLGLVSLVLLAACDGGGGSGSGGTSTGVGGAGGVGTTSSTSEAAGSGGTAGSGGGCSYPPVDNPAGCPDAYSVTYSGQPCSTPGLDCWYPGVGDGLPNGCLATALLTCTDMFSDGGGAEWRAAQ